MERCNRLEHQFLHDACNDLASSNVTSSAWSCQTHGPESQAGSPSSALHNRMTLACPLDAPSPMLKGIQCPAPGNHLLELPSSLSPQVPLNHLLVPKHPGGLQAASKETAVGPPSQTQAPRETPTWLGCWDVAAALQANAESGTPGEAGQNITQPLGLQHTDPTHLPL